MRCRLATRCARSRPPRQRQLCSDCCRWRPAGEFTLTGTKRSSDPAEGTGFERRQYAEQQSQTSRTLLTLSRSASDRFSTASTTRCDP